MQIRITHFSLLALFAITIFTSCKKSNETGKRIPATASFVLLVNGQSLNKKLSWDEIKKNQVFKDIYADTSVSRYVKEAMDNPDNTGIDVKADLIFYVQQDTIGGYAVLQGKINDAGKFSAFFTNVTKNPVVAGKNSENSVSNNKMIATWNNDRFAIVFDAAGMQYDDNARQLPFPGNTDSLQMAPVNPVYTKRDLSAAGSMAFNLEESNSLSKNEKFTGMLKNKGDLHFWINSGQMMGTGGMGTFDMLNVSRLYKEVYVTGTATFLDGKIEMDIKSYAGKELTNLFEKYESKNIDESMLKRLPSENVAMVAALNFKPAGLLALIKLAGVEGFANMGASSLGFTLDDFVKANKGDLLCSVSGLRTDTGRSTADIFLSVSIADKTAFNKLIDAGKKLMLARGGDSVSKSIFQNSNENYFAIGTNQEHIDAFFNNNKNNNAATPLPDKFTGNPAAVYVNFQHVFQSMTPLGKDSITIQLHNASREMWDNMLITGGQVKEGGILQKVVVNLVDKKANSLKQLNNYFGRMISIDKQRKRNGPWPDSTSIIHDTTFAFRNIQ